jgi:hypothetical protein
MNKHVPSERTVYLIYLSFFLCSLLTYYLYYQSDPYGKIFKKEAWQCVGFPDWQCVCACEGRE